MPIATEKNFTYNYPVGASCNLRKWWTEADRKEFERRAQCAVDQYSGYTIIDDIKINGKLTMLRIWPTSAARFLLIFYGRMEPLDGLTPEQRFFVAYGQSWCSNERDEDKRPRATVEPHSREKYRAGGKAKRSETSRY